jgi:hypothetical protein
MAGLEAQVCCAYVDKRALWAATYSVGSGYCARVNKLYPLEKMEAIPQKKMCAASSKVSANVHGSVSANMCKREQECGCAFSAMSAWYTDCFGCI